MFFCRYQGNEKVMLRCLQAASRLQPIAAAAAAAVLLFSLTLQCSKQ